MARDVNELIQLVTDQLVSVGSVFQDAPEDSRTLEKVKSRWGQVVSCRKKGDICKGKSFSYVFKILLQIVADILS